MKRHAFLVGAFVLLALVLAVAGVITLGKSSLFATRYQAVVYFGGSVKGLYVGAPVTFRGVKMGEVTRIGVQVDPKTLETRIPVRMALSTETLQIGAGTAVDQPIDLNALVQRGLRAKLTLQSVVTGQTAIELDFKPNTPANLYAKGQSSLPEIPTMQDKLDALITQVQELPLGEMVSELRKTVATLDQTLKVTQQALQSSSKKFDATAVEVRNTLTTATTSLQALQGQTNTTLASIQQLSDTTRQTVIQVQPELVKTLEKANQAAASAERAMQSLSDLTGSSSPLRADLEGAASDLAISARSLRSFADQVEQQPNAVIFGRKN